MKVVDPLTPAEVPTMFWQVVTPYLVMLGLAGLFFFLRHRLGLRGG